MTFDEFDTMGLSLHQCSWSFKAPRWLTLTSQYWQTNLFSTFFITVSLAPPIFELDPDCGEKKWMIDFCFFFLLWSILNVNSDKSQNFRIFLFSTTVYISRLYLHDEITKLPEYSFVLTYNNCLKTPFTLVNVLKAFKHNISNY